VGDAISNVLVDMHDANFGDATGAQCERSPDAG